MALEASTALTQARNEAGWTKRELGRRSGVSAQVIYLIESGRIANPSLDIALKLAEALGRPVEAIFASNGSSGQGETSGATAPATPGDGPPVASTPPDPTGHRAGVGKS
jgi:DNA-binding XRE family transcriptional regulator